MNVPQLATTGRAAERALYPEKCRSRFSKVRSSNLRAFMFPFIPLHHNSVCKMRIVTSDFMGTGKTFLSICKTLCLYIYKHQKKNHKKMNSLVFRAGSEQRAGGTARAAHRLMGNQSTELPAQPAGLICPRRRGAGLVGQ